MIVPHSKNSVNIYPPVFENIISNFSLLLFVVLCSFWWQSCLLPMRGHSYGRECRLLWCFFSLEPCTSTTQPLAYMALQSVHPLHLSTATCSSCMLQMVESTCMPLGWFHSKDFERAFIWPHFVEKYQKFKKKRKIQNSFTKSRRVVS